MKEMCGERERKKESLLLFFLCVERATLFLTSNFCEMKQEGRESVRVWGCGS